MMSVLIIGAKGMLGNDLMEVFSDWQPIGWDVEDIDITQADAVRDRITELRPDAIINAAAYTDVDGAEEAREAAFAVNEVGVRNVAMAAVSVGAKVVHYSTDYVFAGDRETGYAEHDSPGPAVNAYGESKLAGERALATVRPDYFLVRTAWLYGHHGKNFVETMLQLADQYRQIKVVDDQFGSPTYTKDVARFTRTLLEGGYGLGIYHAVNSGRASWFDFAKKIFEYSDKTMDVKPIPSSEYPRPAKRPQFSVLQNTKGPAMRRWEEALRDYMDTRS